MGSLEKLSIDTFVDMLNQLDRRLMEKYGICGCNIEIKAIGGFAIMHHAMQKHFTSRIGSADIDSLTLDYEIGIQEEIMKIGQDNGAPLDWINNQWYRLMTYHDNLESLITWEDSGYKFNNITLYIADLESIFLFKVRAVDIELKSNRKPRQQDIIDVISIMQFYNQKDFLNINIPQMSKILDMYPEASKYLAENYNKYFSL